MIRVITIINNSGFDKAYAGQDILNTETYTLQGNEYITFSKDSVLFADVASGTVVIGNGTGAITNPTKGWEWLQSDVSDVRITQTSELNKVAVHSSPKPQPEGVTTYAVWVGAGDDLALTEDASLGSGELLDFTMAVGTPITTKDIYFDPRHGRVWVHEAYIKYENAGLGCTISADVVAPPTALQQSINLDYNIINDWLIYAGPGIGTHGLAATPVLVPRTYAADGDWDYDGVNLLPNISGTGNHKITTIERVIHRYINRIPLSGTTTNYFILTSSESAELPVNIGYFMRVTVNNASNTDWHLAAIMEIFRERTFMP